MKYAPEEIAELSRQRSRLAPVERMGLLSDGIAVFRAGAAPLAPWLDLVFAFADDEDYAVAAEVVGGFDLAERRLAGEADRARVRRLVEERLAARFGALGFAGTPDEKDERRLLRAALLRGLALVARTPPVVKEAVARLERSWGGDATALDPNVLDAATIAAARGGDEALFERLVARATTHPDPAEKRRSQVGLASFEAAPLVERAIALTLSDVVPMQDITIYAGALLGNRAARDRTWEFLRERWPAVRQKLSPSLLRRMVENLRELSHRRDEVERFFTDEAASFEAVPAVVSQTRERLRLDSEMQRRAEPELRAWLDGRGVK